MKATLQCFCHIAKFMEFFKYNPQIKDIEQNKDNLSSSFKTLIENLWPDNYIQNTIQDYAPEDFKEKISKLNPLFKGVAANDSKDLVNFIIMKLHLELNKQNQDDVYVEIDQTNKELVFQNLQKIINQL